MIPPLQLVPIATGIVQPVLAKAAPGDSTRMYVAALAGLIYVVKDGIQSPVPFLDISDLVAGGGEFGLLGLAFPADFATSRRFFVHFSGVPGAAFPDPSFVFPGYGDTVLAEVHAPDGDTADRMSMKMVLTVPQPEFNHNGGSIEFSPIDGMLYMGLGDGGGSEDMHGDPGNGQSTNTLLGKILRLDVSSLPYKIPAGNLTGPGVSPEIWDYGLRNPFRSSFDVCTGDYYIGDVGQNRYEEVNVELPGDGRRNYGWRVMEGMTCNFDLPTPPGGCDPANYTAPALEVFHDFGRCAMIGGYVYRGSAIPAFRGTYFWGDYCAGLVGTLRWQGAGVDVTDVFDYSPELGTSGKNISSFGQDNEGEIYVVFISDGVVAKLVPQ